MSHFWADLGLNCYASSHDMSVIGKRVILPLTFSSYSNVKTIWSQIEKISMEKLKKYNQKLNQYMQIIPN